MTDDKITKFVGKLQEEKKTSEAKKRIIIGKKNEPVAEQITSEPVDNEVVEVEASETLTDNQPERKYLLADSGIISEAEEERTSHSTVYRRADRTNRKVISSVPVFYHSDKTGKYEHIKNTLKDEGDVISNEDGLYKIKFDKHRTSGKIFDLEKNSHAVSLYSHSFETHNDCSCELCTADNSVTLQAGNDIELQYTIYNDKIKEDIIIKSQQNEYVYNFKLNIGNLAVEEGDGNRILLKDGDNVEFIIPPPYMYDAQGVRSTDVYYEVEIDGEVLNLRVVADKNFINDPERQFPVTIDPQIEIYNPEEGLSCCTHTQDDSGSEEIDYTKLLADDSVSNYDSFSWVEIKIDKEKLLNRMGVVANVILHLKVLEGNDYFTINGTRYESVKDKEHKIDITDLYNSSGNTFSILIYALRFGSYYAKTVFYNSGGNAPKLSVTFDEYDGYVEPLLKEFELGDKAVGYVDLDTGVLTTAVTSFSGGDFVLPLNITHIHRLGISDEKINKFGLNWQLNLNKQLRRLTFETAEDTKYLFIDEIGVQYIFDESYYYVTNNNKYFVSKERVTIDISGNLWYLNHKVYRHYSCRGYTLISEIKDFINSDLIEQRRSELIEIESFINNCEVSLVNCKVINPETYEIVRNLDNLTKNDYQIFLKFLNDDANYVIMSAMEYENLKLNKNYESYVKVLLENAALNTPIIQNKFNQYFIKKAEHDKIIRHTPVNYIQDTNGIISGFNNDGNLVAMYDAYGNYVMLEYDDNNIITSIYDSNNKAMDFVYDNGLLKSITDNLGRTVNYEYDEKNKKLTQIVFADGSTLDFEYQSDRMRKIVSSDRFNCKINHANGKVDKIENTRNKVDYDKNLKPLTSTTTESEANISLVNIEYSDNKRTTVTNKDGSSQTYEYDFMGRVTKYTETDSSGISTTTTYSYEKSDDDGKIITETTTSDIADTVTVIEKKDKFELTTYKDSGWEDISENTRKRTETKYSYNESNKLISETTTCHTEINGNDHKKTQCVKYSYNAQGSLVLTESYVEGEELTTGKNFEERVYDENGNIVKTIAWNTLDSSSKFYSESKYAENGHVISEKDETGENDTEYEYVAGTNAVNSVKYPNGSRFAYGRNPFNNSITSVTQSTESGEANTTDIVYVCGMPVEVKSGNTVIDYMYDYAGRKTRVEINGDVLLSNSYTEFKYNSDKPLEIDYGKTTKKLYYTDNAYVETVTSQTGSRESESDFFTLNKTVAVKDSAKSGTYTAYTSKTDKKGNIANETVYELGTYSSTKVTYSYDKYDNLKSVTAGKITEEYTYDSYNTIATRTISGEVEHTYEYTYKDTAARTIDNFTVLGYTFIPQTDVYGRHTGKEIKNGSDKIAAEYVTYRKVGDHATNMPSTVFFASGSTIKENIKYKYDKCGNISEIYENGELKARYTYDDLNRLVREDNKALGKTFLINYDLNGNILNKFVTIFTLKASLYQEEFSETYNYGYQGDRLVAFNDEEFAYNKAGSPITYRGKRAEWLYAKFLANYNGTSFSYDGKGRRLSKNNIAYTYDSNGNLIKSSDGSESLEFIYDNTGVVGVKYNDTLYFYRKDAQGNIIAILNSDGAVVARYEYDAWGNHTVLAEEEYLSLAKANPFRYRSYYFDTETGLYYLKTRYYDPELGRFISQDSVDYAAPETINGLNLYAYCLNNPISYIDQSGSTPVNVVSTLGMGLDLLANILGGLGSFLLKVSKNAFASVAKISMYLLDDVGGAIFNPAYLKAMGKATNLEFKGKVLSACGKVFSAIGYALLAVDVGLSIFNNFTNPNLSLSRKITDSIFDAGYSIGSFALSMAFASVGGPLGIIASIGISVVSWAFQTLLPDLYNDIKIGFNTFITETLPNAWNDFVNGWNYFWSFSWAR